MRKLLPYLFIVSLIYLSACENDEGDIANLGAKKIGVEEAKEVVLTFTSSGRTKAILTAPIMLRVQDTVAYIEFPKTLKVDFYNDSTGLVESTLTALYGRYKETQDVVFLKDSVKVKNTKGETLYTDEMYWDRRRTGWEFYTDKPVRIRTLTHYIDGKGLEASQDFKQRLIKQVTGTVKIPASQFPQ
jgi:LPS export ABC transporter protein LptC